MAKKNSRLAHEARLACEKWREYFKVNIDQYHMMHTFVLGQQWTDDEQDEMLKTFRKVPLQSNHLATMANTMMGEQQQNTPQLEVVPMTNCDYETAYLRQLIVKDIMFSQDAQLCYQVTAGQSFIGGFSAFLWDTDYVHRRSFDQQIVPRYFKDASRTFFDIGAEKVNKTDGGHCGYIVRMTRDKFRSIYGKELEEKISKTMSPTQSQDEIALAVQPSEGDDPFTWADNDGITIIHYYKRKYVPDVLYKMSNGNTYNQEELDELIDSSLEINAQNNMMQIPQGMPEGMQQESMQTGQELIDTQEPSNSMSGDYAEAVDVQDPEPANEMITLWDNGEMVRIVEKRNIKASKIMHYKIAGDYVLEKSECASEQLPLVFVDQNSYYDKNGKQICRSFFGDCKDTQRYINYLRTQSAFVLKVSRYDQWLGSKKNVSSLDTQRQWRDPSAMQGLLTFDESPGGYKPEPIKPPELSVSLTQQYQLAVDDLYRMTGLHPVRMGEEGNETSGAAIDARTRQGSYPTFVAFNSINRAIATGGEIVNEMVPKVYDAERVISLMTPDEGQKNITINRQADEYGMKIENDIRKGTFEVRLKPGPSYEGQKQMYLDSLRQILQADPQSWLLIADLYADNLPVSNSIEIKNRLKTRVPPEIIEAGKTGKMPQNNGQPNPQQQAMQQEMAAQQQEMQFKAKEIELKEQEIQLKQQQIMLEAQFKIQELETERLEAAGKLKEQELRYAAEMNRTQSDENIAHADNLVRILTHKMGQ